MPTTTTPTLINSTNKVIQFNNKKVPWAINVDEIVHDINTNDRNSQYSDSSLNKLNIISKQNDIDISSANSLNLTANNNILFNSESSFNDLAKFNNILTNDLSINNELQINDTIIKSDTITLNPGLDNEINLFDKFNFKLEEDIDKYNIILQATQENSGGAFILSTLTETIATI